MNRILIYCFLLLLFPAMHGFSQSIAEQTDDAWLSAIRQHAITPANDNVFHQVPPGYALYFSAVDSLRVPYLVYVPKGYDSSKSYQLIVYLHGGVVSLDSFPYRKASFAVNEPVFSLADKYNSIVLYPFGKKDFGWVKQPAAFENIITELQATKQRYHINMNAVFLGGMSNGGSATFWFVTHYPQLFTAFYAFSAMPKLYHEDISYENLTAMKPMYSINAKDDEGYSFLTIRSLYKQHKDEAPGWHFDSVESGGHGFLYDDPGMMIMDSMIQKMTVFSGYRKKVYDSLQQVLIDVDDSDQKYRLDIDFAREKYGGNSKEVRQIFKDMATADSLNLIVAESIVHQYGWLGPDEVGSQANSALFMVIQHNDLPVQEKFLPLIRQAANNGKVRKQELAMLEDRVAHGEGKHQIYGSQLRWDLKTNTYIIWPISDVDNLDKRRTSVGLPPYADYLKGLDITWNIEQYKKDLPETEKHFQLKQ